MNMGECFSCHHATQEHVLSSNDGICHDCYEFLSKKRIQQMVENAKDSPIRFFPVPKMKV